MTILPNNTIEFTPYSSDPEYPSQTLRIALQHIKHVDTHVCIWSDTVRDLQTHQTTTTEHIILEHTLITNIPRKDRKPVFGYIGTYRYRLNDKDARNLDKYLDTLKPHEITMNNTRKDWT